MMMDEKESFVEDLSLKPATDEIPSISIVSGVDIINLRQRYNRKPKWFIPIFPGLGLLLGLLAGISFSFSTLIVKMLPNTHPMMLLFVRSIVQISFFLPFAIHQKLPLPRKRIDLIPLAGRAIFGSLGISGLYFAVQMIPLADATTIAFSSPVFVSIFAFIFLKEPCGIFHSLMVILALVGVVLVGKPTFIFGGDDSGSLLRLEGSLVALGSTLSQGFVYIFLRKLLNVPSVTVILFFSLFSLIVSGLVLIIVQDLRYPDCGRDGFLILLGGIFSCGGQILMTSAAKIEFAGPLSLSRTVDILMAFILQVLVLGYYPAWNSLLGAFIILLSVVLICLKKWKKEKPDLFLPIEFFFHFKKKPISTNIEVKESLNI